MDCGKKNYKCFDRAELNLEPGEIATLTVSVDPADATDPALRWFSDNPEVAQVDDGEITAIVEGIANISVMAQNGLRASCRVVVQEPYPSISRFSGHYEVDQSSYYRNKNSRTHADLSGRSAVDTDSDTAWCTNSRGEGEWIALTIADGQKYRVSSLGFVNGYIRKSSTWQQNCRIKDLEVYCDDQYVTTITLEDTKSYQVHNLPQPVVGSHFRFVIKSVYYGSQFSDTCLTELDLLD